MKNLKRTKKITSLVLSIAILTCAVSPSFTQAGFLDKAINKSKVILKKYWPVIPVLASVTGIGLLLKSFKKPVKPVSFGSKVFGTKFFGKLSWATKKFSVPALVATGLGLVGLLLYKYIVKKNKPNTSDTPDSPKEKNNTPEDEKKNESLKKEIESEIDSFLGGLEEKNKVKEEVIIEEKPIEEVIIEKSEVNSEVEIVEEEKLVETLDLDALGDEYIVPNSNEFFEKEEVVKNQEITRVDLGNTDYIICDDSESSDDEDEYAGFEDFVDQSSEVKKEKEVVEEQDMIEFEKGIKEKFETEFVQ